MNTNLKQNRGQEVLLARYGTDVVVREDRLGQERSRQEKGRRRDRQESTVSEGF